MMKVIKKAVKLVTAVKLVKLVPVVIVMIMVIPVTTVRVITTVSSDDSDRGNKNFSGDEAEEVNNEIDIECDDGIDDNDDDDDGEGNLGDNIDSATINKEPELDESNISDVIKQNIELSSDILICGDKVAPGALATAFEKLLKNDKLRKSFLSKFSPSDEKIQIIL